MPVEIGTVIFIRKKFTAPCLFGISILVVGIIGSVFVHGIGRELIFTFCSSHIFLEILFLKKSSAHMLDINSISLEFSGLGLYIGTSY